MMSSTTKTAQERYIRTDNYPAPRLHYRRRWYFGWRSQISSLTLACCDKINEVGGHHVKHYCNYFLVSYIIFIIKSYLANSERCFWTHTNWSSDFCVILYASSGTHGKGSFGQFWGKFERNFVKLRGKVSRNFTFGVVWSKSGREGGVVGADEEEGGLHSGSKISEFKTNMVDQNGPITKEQIPKLSTGIECFRTSCMKY